MLWMKRNMPEQFDDSVMDLSRLAMGNRVGDLAMGYFGDFNEVTYSDNKSKMLRETEQLLYKNTPVICEASFSHSGLFCMVDILQVFEDCVEIVEVKSSTSDDEEDSDDIKEIYLHDMAFQHYVLTGCGLNVRKVSLLSLNRKYERCGNLDIQQLFKLTDCTGSVLGMQAAIPNKLNNINEIVMSESEPDIQVGSRCNNPYECGYKGWCWRDVPENSVFDIGWRMWGSKKDAAYSAGIVTFVDALNGSIDLSDKQRRQVETVVYDQPPSINRPAIKAFLSSLCYPIYHLDFETYQQLIPLWDGVRPYRHIPFQYSLHIEHEDGSLEHKEFLGKEGEDPRRLIAERLCEDIPFGACSLAYNMTFEKKRLEHLAELHPDLAEHLINISENMHDLCDPFKNGDYYCKAMGRGYSIKYVLPALFPDDPELNYNNLKIIQHGGDAMNAFATLHEKSPEEVEKIREALLAYCKLDTLAMVKILEKLRETDVNTY